MAANVVYFESGPLAQIMREEESDAEFDYASFLPEPQFPSQQTSPKVPESVPPPHQ